MERNFGRPYVWGAAGMKRFDCSGFVGRVAEESGYFRKRTTAQKLYFSTRPAPKNEPGASGNLIFFDDLKHAGIVNDRSSFSHARTWKGTILSQRNPYRKSLAGGEHKFFAPPGKRDE